MKTLFAPLFLALSLGTTNASAFTFYKWVDADGQVQYGDAPPASADPKKVTVKDNVINVNKSVPSLEALSLGGATITTSGFKSALDDRYQSASSPGGVFATHRDSGSNSRFGQQPPRRVTAKD